MEAIGYWAVEWWHWIWWIGVVCCCIVTPLLARWINVWRHEGVTLKQIGLKVLLHSAIALPPLYALWYYLQLR